MRLYNRCILLNYTLALQYQYLLHYLLVYYLLLMQLVNGARFLNDKPLSLSSAHLAAALSPAPVIVIFPLTRIYASL